MSSIANFYRLFLLPVTIETIKKPQHQKTDTFLTEISRQK
jgi:hypothetical protein